MIPDELLEALADCQPEDAELVLGKLGERLGCGLVLEADSKAGCVVLAGLANASHETIERFLKQAHDRSPHTFPAIAQSLLDRGALPDEVAFVGEPRSLAPDLLPVPVLSPDMVPALLRGWVFDIAKRGSFPPEYVAIPALVALSSVVGRRCGIKPKRYDDWTVIPNLWGLVVGPPGVFKTPAMTEALSPLARLETAAREAHKSALADYEAERAMSASLSKAAKTKLDSAAKSGKVSQQELVRLAREATEKNDIPRPTAKRLMLVDTTTEKLGEVLSENPGGVLVYRDEMIGFLKTLSKQGHENDRAFYLEAWNGTGSYTYDRIGRGTVHIPSVCVSLLGGIQPGPLSRYLRNSAEGDEADGFASRFQLLVYPNPPAKFVNVDRYADTEAKNGAFGVFERLHRMPVPEDTADMLTLHFAPDAQPVFDAWRTELENRIRSHGENPLLTMHLSKYRSLCPSLALLFHLIDGTPGAVPLDALLLAIRWCDFLEAHARRIYQAALDGSPEVAQNLADRIKASLPNPFTIREVVKKGWSGLDTAEAVSKAIGVLEDRGWVQSVEHVPDGGKGGRPSQQIWINPALLGSASSPFPGPAVTTSPTETRPLTTKTDSGFDDPFDGYPNTGGDGQEY